MGKDGDTHRNRLPLSSVLRRDGAPRRDPCEPNREALLDAPPLLFDSVEAVGVEGSGLTVMLDRALSVLEPVMELKRELSSTRGIVTKQRPAWNKGIDSVGEVHSRS